VRVITSEYAGLSIHRRQLIYADLSNDDVCEALGIKIQSPSPLLDLCRALVGVTNARPVVLHLCSMAPDDTRLFHSAYNIGDVERMAADALIDSRAGKNVFIEPRLVRPGRPVERGGINSTLAVFASVADSDSDTGKPFTATIPASAVVETSPNNEHSWYFLKRAIGADDAQELGRLMRQSGGGDACSGNCVQPFRCCGTPNFPNRKKIERGRTVVPTRFLSVTDKTYTADELRAHFSAAIPPALPTKQTPEPARAVHSRYSRGMAKAMLAAEPGNDRSASFFAAINHAVRGGLTANEFEALARKHPNGCAGKYDGRLRQEIDRCYAKMGLSENSDGRSGNSDGKRWPYHRLIADPELNASALRVAGWVRCSGAKRGHLIIQIKTVAAQLQMPKSTAWDGLNRLLARRWLILVAADTYAPGPGPSSEISDAR
jgi:hypothetical protein